MPYLIYCTEDGPRINHFERDKIQEELEDCGIGHYTAFSSPPKESDPNYWGEHYLVVDGELAVPHNETVVTKRVMPQKK